MEGADIIDVEASRTQPGADPVPAEEEMRRVIPVISRLARSGGRTHLDRHVQGAGSRRPRSEAGARIVNDITGLHRDPDMAKVAADYDASVVVMHSKGDPQDDAACALRTTT